MLLNISATIEMQVMAIALVAIISWLAPKFQNVCARYMQGKFLPYRIVTIYLIAQRPFCWRKLSVLFVTTCERISVLQIHLVSTDYWVYTIEVFILKFLCDCFMLGWALHQTSWHQSRKCKYNNLCIILAKWICTTENLSFMHIYNVCNTILFKISISRAWFITMLLNKVRFCFIYDLIKKMMGKWSVDTRKSRNKHNLQFWNFDILGRALDGGTVLRGKLCGDLQQRLTLVPDGFTERRQQLLKLRAQHVDTGLQLWQAVAYVMHQ